MVERVFSVYTEKLLRGCRVNMFHTEFNQGRSMGLQGLRCGTTKVHHIRDVEIVIMMPMLSGGGGREEREVSEDMGGESESFHIPLCYGGEVTIAGKVTSRPMMSGLVGGNKDFIHRRTP
jgi:hypothetical protein